MITNSPFIQLLMVILAGAILFLFIRPTVADIRVTQDQVGIYQSELDRVNEVNDSLQEHTNAINLLPLTGVQSLERYLPTSIDEIAVMRDLQALVTETGVRLTALDFGGLATEASTESADETTTSNTTLGESATFSLSVEATYTELKQLLKALEINNYQLTVQSVDVSPGEDGLLAINLDLVTYALGAQSAEVVTKASDATTGPQI